MEAVDGGAKAVFEGVSVRNPQYSLGGKSSGGPSCNPLNNDLVCEEIVRGSIHVRALQWWWGDFSGTFQALLSIDWSGYTSEYPCAQVSGSMTARFPRGTVEIGDVAGELCEEWQNTSVPETHSFSLTGQVTSASWPLSLAFRAGSTVTIEGTVVQEGSPTDFPNAGVVQGTIR